MHNPKTVEPTLSSELQAWLASTSGNKTFGELNKVFSEKSHALALMLLLFPSATPLPTGGVTNVLEIIAMIISIQLITGRSTIWIPNRWQSVNIGEHSKSRVVRWMLKTLRWSEKFSHHNLDRFLSRKIGRRFTGVALLLFTIGAFVAPPFSGLDTLPSLAVVLVSISMLVEDRAIFMAGLTIGILGVASVAWTWPTLIDQLF